MDLRDRLTSKIKVLSETIWEHRAKRQEVDDWLANFPDGREQLHALWLLSQFMYFADVEMRELLRSLFRDLVKYPIVAAVRGANNDTTDDGFLAGEFVRELERTRFLGMGNPSESGCHLLYYFRQENRLPKKLFIYTHEIFRRVGGIGEPQLRDPDVKRYVYLDDFCGSGDQATEYSRDVLQDIKLLDKSIEARYCVLFATSAGLERVRRDTGFDHADAVFELDESYRCFTQRSRYFVSQPQEIEKEFAEQMCRRYGTELWPHFPLGYRDGQLLLGFHHNTPDNTLPVVWYDEDGGRPWTPIFRRYPKLYT
jgi:hypothetical protein